MGEDTLSNVVSGRNRIKALNRRKQTERSADCPGEGTERAKMTTRVPDQFPDRYSSSRITLKPTLKTGA